MKKSTFEPELESPIPFHVGSNGEFAPRAKTDRDRLAERTFAELVIERARKLGVSRREFVQSVLGTTTALGVINAVYGCGSDGSGGAGGGGQGGQGGCYGVGGDMMDPDECGNVEGDEFIMDVQTHHVNPMGPWRTSNPGLEAILEYLPQSDCGDAVDEVGCYDIDHYIRELFVNSDTSVAVLSALPGPTAANGLEPDEMAATMDLVDMLSGSKRSLIHAIVHPEVAVEIDGMQALSEDYTVGAWKVYTPLNMNTAGSGWRLDDPQIGIPFIEKARELGIKNICCHKGLTLPGFSQEFGDPSDVGIVAAAFPDVNFVVYHSAWESNVAEGAYDEAGTGVDRLIKAVSDNGIARNTGNVYAELGSTWRQLMTIPDQAAHVLGKLLLHIGEDRVVWGTDSIWYGSPQDQIAAFRAFEISEQFQETYGYPALTKEIKAKIFGLNSAGIYGIDPAATLGEIAEDQIAQQREARRDDPRLRLPSFRKAGPQTRQELFDFVRYERRKV